MELRNDRRGSVNDHDDILVALRRIIRAVDLRSRKLVKESGLTAPQLVVLMALQRNGAMTAGAIARTASLSQPTITPILERLQRAGLIERTRNETDKRKWRVELTQAGESAVLQAPELLHRGFLKAFRALPDWEKHMLISALQRTAELMDAEDLDAWPLLAPNTTDGK